MNLFHLNNLYRVLSAVLTLAFLPFVPLEAYFSAAAVANGMVATATLELSAGVNDSKGDLGIGFPTYNAELGVEHASGSVTSELTITSETVGEPTFCGALAASVSTAGISQLASATSFALGPVLSTNDLTMYDVSFDVPNSTTTLENIPHGAGCTITFTLRSDQVGVSAGTGFSDEITVTWQLTAQQIVLNEVLAGPDSGQVEFIELYNNGSVPVDVTGWAITEESGSGNTISHTIVSVPSLSQDLVAYDDSGSNIVPAGGHLALKFAGNVQYLNNEGDTITLFDTAGLQLDTYSYSTSLTGKSDARIPDGVGNWIDPIPTPGAANQVEVSGEVPVPLSETALEPSNDNESSGSSVNQTVAGMEGYKTPVESTESQKGETDETPIEPDNDEAEVVGEQLGVVEGDGVVTEKETFEEIVSKQTGSTPEAQTTSGEVEAQSDEPVVEVSEAGESEPTIPAASEGEETSVTATSDIIANKQSKVAITEVSSAEVSESPPATSNLVPEAADAAQSLEDESEGKGAEESEAEASEAFGVTEEEVVEAEEVAPLAREEEVVPEKESTKQDSV